MGVPHAARVDRGLRRHPDGRPDRLPVQVNRQLGVDEHQLGRVSHRGDAAAGIGDDGDALGTRRLLALHQVDVHRRPGGGRAGLGEGPFGQSPGDGSQVSTGPARRGGLDDTGPRGRTHGGHGEADGLGPAEQPDRHAHDRALRVREGSELSLCPGDASAGPDQARSHPQGSDGDGGEDLRGQPCRERVGRLRTQMTDRPQSQGRRWTAMLLVPGPRPDRVLGRLVSALERGRARLGLLGPQVERLGPGHHPDCVTPLCCDRGVHPTGPSTDPLTRVLEHTSGPLLVLGGPGTGKTTALVDLVTRRVANGVDPAAVLMLAPSRRAASQLRDRVAARLGRTIREPLARTAHSYAFGLLRREAARAGGPAPRLLAGAEQELIISELLAGSATTWPEQVGAALRTRAFAGQVRDLLLRAVERDCDAGELIRLAEQYDRPVWSAVGAFASEYAAVTALAHPSAYDPAELVRAAVDLLRTTPDLLAAERAERRLVVVDDIAEADPALLDLVELLAADGPSLVATADPDSAVFGFRGADPQAVRGFGDRFATSNGHPAPSVVLTRSFRLPPTIAEPVRAVATRLGGRGAWRAWNPATNHVGRFDTAVLASTTDEIAHVAALLRRRHLVDGVDWSQMAVLVRSAGDLAGVRRTLSRHRVPVHQRSDEVSLWQQAPVRALLDLLSIVADPTSATEQTVIDVLLGPLGSLDPARLTHLRRSIGVAQRRAGDTRAPDGILRAAVIDGEPMPDGSTDAGVDALAATVRAGRASMARHESVEAVLWALWDSVGVAQRWREAALAGLRDAASADRDLDAVVAVFAAAARFTDRLPGAGVQAFLDHVRARLLPGDSWSIEVPTTEAVSVLTAHAAVGAEWDTVAVCRVQEDLWPDLRRRQTLVGVDDVVAVLDQGRLPTAAERVSALLSSERRLFHLALSRARSHLLVTAVDDGELRPSRLLDEVDPRAGDDRPIRVADDVLSLPTIVAQLRAVVCAGDGLSGGAPSAERTEAARLLAELAAHGVPGASPDQWYGLAHASDSRPLVAGDEQVRLSPSQVEGYLRCPLRWMLQRCGGDSGPALRQSVGILVHQLASEASEHRWGARQIHERYEQLWTTVDAGRGWVSRRERARVDAMVDRLIEWLEANEREYVGAEVDIAVEVDGAVIRGRVDRLERDARGRLVVVDFKTGTAAPPQADLAEHPQLGVYQWLVARGAADHLLHVHGDAESSTQPGGGVLVHLGLSRGDGLKEQSQPALADADDPEWPHRLLSKVVAGVGGATFAALVNSGCGGCPVRTSCPAHAEGGRVVP